MVKILHPQESGALQKLIPMIIVISLFISSSAFALEPDIITHFATGAGYGFAIGTITYHVTNQMGSVARILTSSGLALVPGLAWEIKDSFEKGNHFGWDDLLADGVGAITGSIAAELINGQLWISASGRQIRLVGKW
jgi:putative lipoprotein